MLCSILSRRLLHSQFLNWCLSRLLPSQLSTVVHFCLLFPETPDRMSCHLNIRFLLALSHALQLSYAAADVFVVASLIDFSCTADMSRVLHNSIALSMGRSASRNSLLLKLLFFATEVTPMD